METTPRRGRGFQKPQAVTALRQGQKGTASSSFVSTTQIYLEEVTQIPSFLCLSCPHVIRPAPLPRPKGGQQPVLAAYLLPYHNILKAWSHISSTSSGCSLRHHCLSLSPPVLVRFFFIVSCYQLDRSGETKGGHDTPPSNGRYHLGG